MEPSHTLTLTRRRRLSPNNEIMPKTLRGIFKKTNVGARCYAKFSNAALRHFENTGMRRIHKNKAQPCVSPSAGAKKAA